jgi:hypothetical protein
MPKLRKTPKGWNSGDVEWYSLKKSKGAKRGKILAYSTKASSDLIVMLAEENPDATIIELQKMINFDAEAEKVLQAYIDAGQGEERLYGRIK